MNPQELQKNIALYYSRLSPKMQEIFSSMQWLESIKQISAKYVLSEIQNQTLGTETMLLLLGITHTEEYEKILKSELKLSDEASEKILYEIKEAVYKNIQTELSEAFNKNINQKISEEEIKEIQEKIKKENTSWEQNVNFIVSGGDYSVFLSQQTENINPPTVEKTNPPTQNLPTTRMEEISSPVAQTKENKTSTQQPTKITDIKNKFTI